MKIVLKKPTKKQVIKFLKYLLIVLAGNAITAAGSAFFIIPNSFAVGGTTGLGSFVRDITGKEWLVSVTVYIANISLFVIGAILLGKKFAAATLLGTLLYPTFLSLFTFLNGLYVQANGTTIGNGEFMCVIFGGMLYGLGVALVVRVGASTGGTDIPPLIFKKFFGTPVSVSIWIVDMSIIMLQFLRNSVENVLCGVLIAVTASIVIDFVSPIGMKKTQVKIVSKKYREIREMILNKLNRGVTVLNGQTGYLKEKCFVLLTIVSNRELVRVKEEVQKIDPEAFMTVSVVSEVRGRGFSSEGLRLPPEAEGHDLEDLEETTLPPVTQEGTGAQV